MNGRRQIRVWREPALAELGGARFRWNRSNTIALARHDCVFCHGLGLLAGRGRNGQHACNCALREIFRICLRRYRYYQWLPKFISQVRFEVGSSGRQTGAGYGRQIEEYCADFELSARRALRETPELFRVFWLHFLRRLQWRECVHILRIDRGTFFHDVYRVEQRCARMFAELRPYGIFPIDQYFRRTVPAPTWWVVPGTHRKVQEAHLQGARIVGDRGWMGAWPGYEIFTLQRRRSVGERLRAMAASG